MIAVYTQMAVMTLLFGLAALWHYRPPTEHTEQVLRWLQLADGRRRACPLPERVPVV